MGNQECYKARSKISSMVSGNAFDKVSSTKNDGGRKTQLHSAHIHSWEVPEDIWGSPWIWLVEIWGKGGLQVQGMLTQKTNPRTKTKKIPTIKRLPQYLSLNTLFSAPFKAPQGTNRRMHSVYRKGAQTWLKRQGFANRMNCEGAYKARKREDILCFEDFPSKCRILYGIWKMTP